MTRAGLLLLLLGLPLVPAPAMGQAQPAERQSVANSPAARPFGGSPSRPRMPKTLDEPLALVPPNATAMRSEPAPIPNRDIELPRARTGQPPAATLEPMLLPSERQQGMTFGREHLRETGPDRPFDNIVPGARLRIPFESTIPKNR
jgi:hypothetical protein